MNGHVIQTIDRADPAIIMEFAIAGSATVCEAMGRKNLLSTRLRPIFPGESIAGSAVTISPAYGDNYMVHVAIETIQRGDILVLAPPMPDERAYFGEMMATSAIAFGCAGLIIDAGIRDVRDLATLGFPAWASSICAAGTDRRTLGYVNTPIICGGVHINPGDVIVADDDGICCVPRLQAQSILNSSKAKLEREKEFRERLAAGESGLDVYDLRTDLKELGLEYL